MSQIFSDRLSIDQIADLWAAETEKAGFGAEHIAEDLVKAAESGEFEYPTHSRENAPLGEYTYKEDWIDPKKSKTLKGEQPYVGPYRSALTMEGGQSANAIDIQNYLKARQTAPGATDRETRRTVASEIFLSVEGLRRWCDEPEFAEWANIRGLSRPRFIDRACGDGTGQASAVDQEPEEVNTAEATAGEDTDFLILDPAGTPDPIAEEPVLIEFEDPLPDAEAPPSGAANQKVPLKERAEEWANRLEPAKTKKGGYRAVAIEIAREEGIDHLYIEREARRAARARKRGSGENK